LFKNESATSRQGSVALSVSICNGIQDEGIVAQMRKITHTKYSLIDLWIRFRFWVVCLWYGSPPFEIIETFTIELDDESVE